MYGYKHFFLFFQLSTNKKQQQLDNHVPKTNTASAGGFRPLFLLLRIKKNMLSSLTVATVVDSSEKEVEVSADLLRDAIPPGAKLGNAVIQRFSIAEYSSSAPGAVGIAAKGTLGEWVNCVATPQGKCLAVLMPFANGPGVEGPNRLAAPVDIGSTQDVIDKYCNFFQRDPDGTGFYHVNPTAPFAHRLELFTFEAKDDLVVSEQAMSNAMAEHERHDKVFDLKEGLQFAIVPLESAAAAAAEGGALRLVFSMTVMLLPKARPNTTEKAELVI